VSAIGASAFALWFLTRVDPRKQFEQGLSFGRRDPAAGERLLRSAIESRGGTYPDAQIGLCLLLANQGAWDAAVVEFDGVDKRVCREDLLLSFGRVALEAQHRSLGRAALETLGDRQSRDAVSALELLLVEYGQWGQQDESIVVARKLARMEPDNPRRWATLVELLKATYRDTECLTAIRQAMERDLPADYQNAFRHRLIQQLIVEGDTASAWKELATLRESEGDSPRIRGYEVDLYRLNGELDKALETINAMFPQLKGSPVAFYTRGVTYLDLGRFEAAARDLERVVTAEPYNERARFKLSEACRSQGDEATARFHRDIANDISSKRSRINELLKKRREHQDDPQLCEQLAELYGALGEDDSAKHWSRRAAARH
jgi:tetratricopeptide (TPR) repeat protein